ncbi:MAG: penicillin acylase family protein [Spirochaetota bacterium]
MRLPYRIALWVGVGILGLLVVTAGVVLRTVRRAFPDVRGTVTVAGLDGEVEILRDDAGVPHVRATTKHDLFFAQGYVHAQDRFWQMEFSRRIGAGRLSEVLGESMVDSDRFLRTMDFAGVAEAEYAQLGEPYRSQIEAYAAGVNAYIADREPGRLGLEFTLLALTGTPVNVEPWTPVHSLTWGKVMAYDLGGNLSRELGNIEAQRFGGTPLLDVLRPPFPQDHPYIASMEEVNAFRDQLGLAPLPARDRVSRPRVTSDGVGSNNWVIGGSRTESGLPLLANDMHLGVQMPSIWYEIGLHLRDDAGSGGAADPDAGRGVRGYSFPGVPGVIAGQNDRIAWGVTNVSGDVQDAHIVEVGREDPDRYLAGGEWRDMDVRRELIHVAGSDDPRVHEVRTTVFGPVITDLPSYRQWFSYDVHTGEEPASLTVAELALEWPALSPEALLTAVLDLNWARDYEGFRDAMSRWESPGQNVVYADRDGTIAYQTTGSYPDRPVGHGQIPSSGRGGPSGVVAFDRLPAALNPEKDYIVTANQPVVPPEYPHPLGMDFADGTRAWRIAQLIEQADEPIGADYVARMHGDVFSRAAAELVEHLVELDANESVAVWRAYREGRRAPAGETDDAAQTDHLAADLAPAALEILSGWDGVMRADSAGAAIYAYVYVELMHQLFADEVPSHALPIASSGFGQAVLRELLREPTHHVWDDKVTPEREDAIAMLGRALVAGVLDAAEEHGDEPAAWQWGESHRITFENQSLGQSGIGFVERILNRGPYPLAGGPSTVNVAHWDSGEPFEVTVIASQRAIYDLADPDNSRFMHTTGQSGHPFHRHYDDMIEPWRKVEYHRSNWSYERAREAAGRRRLLLQPND